MNLMINWKGFNLVMVALLHIGGGCFLNLYCSRHRNIKLIPKSLLFEVIVAASGILDRRRNIQWDL